MKQYAGSVIREKGWEWLVPGSNGGRVGEPKKASQGEHKKISPGTCPGRLFGLSGDVSLASQ